MTHTEMKEYIAEKFDLPKTQADNLLKDLFNKIADEVAEGKDVKMIGLGTLKRTERKERKGRNPQTGEEIQIPASKSAKLNVEKSFKDKINN